MTYRNPHERRVRLNELLVAVAPKGHGADEGGDDELGREDGVDLADELVADVDRGLGDGAAKLEVVRDVVLAAARLAKDVGRARGRLGALVRRGGRLRPGAGADAIVRVLCGRGVVLCVSRHVVAATVDLVVFCRAALRACAVVDRACGFAELLCRDYRDGGERNKQCRGWLILEMLPGRCRLLVGARGGEKPCSHGSGSCAPD